MSHAGISFSDEAVVLSEAEMASIAGSDIVKSVSKLKMEACVRNGSAVEVRPDMCKTSRSHGAVYSEKFEKILESHNKKYKNMLLGVVQEDGTLACQCNSGCE